jgi:hypothetical protein
MDVTSGGGKGGKRAAKKCVPEIDKGKIWMAEDFDLLSERERASWYGVAEARLEKHRPSLTSSQVRKKLGLDRLVRISSASRRFLGEMLGSDGLCG